ncbi:ChbG/HpnK family deacetylase [Candidatus Aminicenantes bacterium AH-873-B07]|nr:ChbG/HpnK family deacetylase [Candidatus Aminicenantes bacterium AH-873-B07]
MKRLIVNADDFGLTSGINKGIIIAHRKGILTSATLIPNMHAFKEAVELAKENKFLGIGIHLNIIRGKPVSIPQKVESLLNNKGHFLTIYPFLKKLVLGKIKFEEVEYEFRAQIEKVLKEDIKVTHFDSEKHIHSIPKIMGIIIKLAKEYKIPRIRFINEYCLSFDIVRFLKSIFISLLNRKTKKNIINSGILIPDRFYGICESGKMNIEKLRKIISNLSFGITEIMTHPGIIDKEYKKIEQEYGSYYLKKERECELQALIDPALKDIIKKEKIQLINYGDISN